MAADRVACQYRVMKEHSLSDKVVLVTGAARRIGAAIVTCLQANGARVAIHYRGSTEDAEQLALTLNEKRPGSSATFMADLLNVDATKRLVTDVVEWAGRLDGLVNNASTFYPTPVGEITEQAFNDLFGSNFKAPLFLSQEAAPHLRRTRGGIVNIVDIHAQRPLRNHPVYETWRQKFASTAFRLGRSYGLRTACRKPYNKRSSARYRSSMPAIRMT
jgi:pteridine reductase